MQTVRLNQRSPLYLLAKAMHAHPVPAENEALRCRNVLPASLALETLALQRIDATLAHLGHCLADNLKSEEGFKVDSHITFI